MLVTREYFQLELRMHAAVDGRTEYLNQILLLPDQFFTSAGGGAEEYFVC